MTQKRIALLINPIAGMGGRVGLKGTDTLEILQEARRRGAEPQAGKRTEQFLVELLKFPEHSSFQLLVPPGKMGADIISANRALSTRLKWHVLTEMRSAAITRRQDTIKAATLLLARKIDLLIFVGGDGTAQDIFETIGTQVPILGIPAGVKIHSGVFANGIATGVNILCSFIKDETQVIKAEIIDLDEQAYRENRLSTKLFGVALVPHVPTLLQPTKMSSIMIDLEKDNLKGIIETFRDTIRPTVLYLLGPGSTLKELAYAFGQTIYDKKTLLGIDAVQNQTMIGMDLSERDILNLLENQTDKEVKIVVTPIGGQGFLFGRGNQPFSPQIIQKVGIKQIEVIATRTKLAGLPQKILRIDTGDVNIDAQFPRHIKVLVDYNLYEMVPVEVC